MSMDEWTKGDRALCIKAGIQTHVGKIYTVRHVYLPGTFMVDEGRRFRNCTPHALLRFEEFLNRPGEGSASIRFIKVTPQDPDAFDREVLEEMKVPVHV